MKIAEFFFLGDLGQLFLLMIYLLLNFLLIFLGTESDIDWMAHHAAKLTYANMPLVIGLAGKNNVLSKLTGFAYESLNVLHRWSARFVIISSAIHIGGRIHVSHTWPREIADAEGKCAKRSPGCDRTALHRMGLACFRSLPLVSRTYMREAS